MTKQALAVVGTPGKKLSLYGRVSTLRQETGLEAQQRALREYQVYKKIPDSDVLEFSDEITGTGKKARPGFEAMMAKVRAGEVHTVLVYSYSRFARNTKQLIDALEEFEKLGVDFVSISEGVDTTTPVGRLMFRFFASLAEFERDQVSERTKLGLKNAVAKGKILGTPDRLNDALVLELHAEGLRYPEIKARTALDLASIKHVVALSGVKRSSKSIAREMKLASALVTRIVKLHQGGHPLLTVQLETGVSKASYYRILRMAKPA